MQGLKADLLRGMWYVALPSADLKPGRMLPKTLLGEPVLLARTQGGVTFALKNICPHRGIPLHYGRFDGETVQCSYHGWRFDRGGTCVEIPSLVEEQDIDPTKIKCGGYPVVEQQGLIWLYFAEKGERPEDGRDPTPPLVPGFDATAEPALRIMQPFVCSVDHAALGLMDPTHAPFVHTSWWFKKNATALRRKEKHFAPTELGWQMVRHPLPPQNLVYQKLFGTGVTTEITYRLPGLRFEHIQGATNQVLGLTAITPVTEEETEVRQMFYVTFGWAKFAAPLLKHLMHVFLNQDRQVVVRQREGLIHDPKLMLIPDADTQGRWWMSVKREWRASQLEGRAFANPIKAKTLYWMS